MENYAGLVRKVAKEVAFATNARYGFTIVTPEDLVQDVWVQLIETDIDLAERDSAEAWVRSTAKQQAIHTAERYLRISGGEGRNKGRAKLDIYDPQELVELSLIDGPEKTLEWQETLARAEQVIQSIIDKLDSEQHRDALYGYYVLGETRNAPKEKTRRHRAQARLTPEEVACLQAWRNFSNPDKRRANPPKVLPEALLRVIGS